MVVESQNNPNTRLGNGIFHDWNGSLLSSKWFLMKTSNSDLSFFPGADKLCP
jgi:hypothetical protein